MSGQATNVVQARDISTLHIENTIRLPVPRQLPPDTVPFVDRESVLEGLTSWLTESGEDAPGHVVVAGIGGVGKTAIAAHWAHGVRDQFPDGELYIDLRGYHANDSLSAEEALNELLCAFLPADRVPFGLAAKVGLYRSLLRERRMLVLLDNAATVDQVRPLLPGTSTCRVLITSRSRLTGLATREGAHRLPLDVLPPDRAVDLLRQVSGPEWIDAEPDATNELARFCGYLPLALRIVAERLVTGQRPSELVEELAEEHERLDALTSEEDDFSSVRTVFSWSYRILPPPVARMFRLLSLPAGTDLSLAAAAALADVSRAEARRQLGVLVGAHLLHESGPRRYRLHDLLRVYSAECAEVDETEADRRAAMRRLHTWLLYSTEKAVSVLYPNRFRYPLEQSQVPRALPEFADPRQALQWCDDESGNLVAAVRQAADSGDHDLAYRLPVVLFGYFVVRKPWDDWITSFGIGLASARRLGERDAQAWLLSGIALPHLDRREFDAAIGYLRQALDAWRDTGQRWGEAWALRDLGEACCQQERFAEAVDHLERAVAIAAEIGDRAGEADARVYLAGACCGLGRFDEALSCVQIALDLRSGTGDSRDVAGVLNTMSRVYRHLERFDAALEHGNRALEIWHGVDYRHGEAVVHENLGETLSLAGRTDEARSHFGAALAIFEELGDPRADGIRDRLAP
ncbi:ATP-binding protein [Amycolatopsis anabasis]|uniref:ATP-binding protein n=1 Tax=Amycolatopsis anabasis TaxID=1840409 RepID=UPI00131BC175|nr:tetratricopeptide repeat protein [Amycolatopsis anabasis]